MIYAGTETSRGLHRSYLHRTLRTEINDLHRHCIQPRITTELSAPKNSAPKLVIYAGTKTSRGLHRSYLHRNIRTEINDLHRNCIQSRTTPERPTPKTLHRNQRPTPELIPAEDYTETICTENSAPKAETYTGTENNRSLHRSCLHRKLRTESRRSTLILKPAEVYTEGVSTGTIAKINWTSCNN